MNRNAKTTNMTSEILIPDATTGGGAIVRGRASSTMYDGYTAYHLDDADFRVVVTPGQIDTMKFIVENGEIKGLQVATAQGNEEWNKDTQTAFGSAYELKTDESGNPIFRNDTNGYDIVYKGAKNTKLTYADFGILELQQNGKAVYYAPFVGGYGVMANTEKPAGRVIFTGTVAGDVEHGEDHMPITESAAKLEFDNGTETLTSNLNGWYNIVAVKDSTGTTVTLSGTSSNTDFAIPDGWDAVARTAVFDSTTYSNGSAEEATAFIQHQWAADENNIEGGNITMTLGFGGKK